MPKKTKSIGIRTRTDKLKAFALKVRLMPTINNIDVPDPLTWDASNGVEAYVAGHNAAIYAMRKIFEEEGFSA